MDAVALFHHIQHAQRVHGHHLDAAIGLLVEGRGQIGRDGGHIQFTLDELGHDLVRCTVELQVVVLAGLAAALHIQQIDQAHGGGALQARNAHAAFCFGGKSPDSSREVSFFIMVQIPSSLCCSNQKQNLQILQNHLLYALKFTIMELKIPLPMQRNCRRAVRARGKPHGTDMENYLPLLQSTSLFAGISAGELRPLLSELGACIRSYGRGEALVQAGAPSRRGGVVLTGSIEAYRPAPGGARIPITHMGPGGVFGDVLGGSSLDSPVTVVASAPCEVLLFPYEKLLQPDGSAARQRLLQNLVRTISDKYFLLSRRVDLLVMKTLRAKVCAYLLSEAEQQGSMTFTIPFSRIQLADYLNCDRSALSRELSLMQRDGLLDTYRSSFKLLEPEALRQMIL